MKNTAGFTKFADVSAREQLRARILIESRLDDLVSLFAAALTEDGISGHYCGRRDEPGLVPLFGDSPRLMGDANVAPLAPAARFGKASRVVDVDGAWGEQFTIMLTPPMHALDKAAIARVRGYCVLYAARGEMLREKEADVMTACGLSLYERFILGRILVGDSLLDIALKLDRSVGVIDLHIADAMKALGMTDRRMAISLAARRGWLLTTMSDFPPLSSENIDYY